MMAIAVVLMAASDLSVTLSAVRLEAQDGRPVVRAVVSGPVRARVEGTGRDLVLVLAGARAADGLLLPEPVAEIQSLAVEQTPEGTRIRIRLEKALEYRLEQESGIGRALLDRGRGTRPLAPSRRRRPRPVCEGACRPRRRRWRCRRYPPGRRVRPSPTAETRARACTSGSSA